MKFINAAAVHALLSRLAGTSNKLLVAWVAMLAALVAVGMLAHQIGLNTGAQTLRFNEGMRLTTPCVPLGLDRPTPFAYICGDLDQEYLVIPVRK